ncbi:MAG: arylamine N-acetyltransferase [bacterium]
MTTTMTRPHYTQWLRPDLGRDVWSTRTASDSPPSLHRPALVRLDRAHVERVPYETLSLHLGAGWGIDPAASTHRIAQLGRGGYCFQLNGAFDRLLPGWVSG